jgi:hypothetical protein
MCAEYGRVIVLEDDLVCSPTVLRYFNRALDLYEKDGRIYSVSAYIYDCQRLRNTKRALVLPLTNSWGWATWQRAWVGFDPDEVVDQRTLESRTFRNFFDINGFYPLAALLLQSLNKHVDSWFIHWYYYIFRNGGMTIYPPRRYVENYGMRDGATHGSVFNPFALLVRYRPALLDRDVEFPDSSQTDYWALDLLRKSREVRAHRWISHIGRWKRRILRQWSL